MTGLMRSNGSIDAKEKRLRQIETEYFAMKYQSQHQPEAEHP